MITKKTLFYWVLYRHRIFQLALFILIMMSVFLRVFPLEMQKRIINTAIASKKIDLLFLYCSLYIVAVIFSGVLKFASNVLQKYLGQKILMHIRQELYEHILRLPPQFFKNTQPGTVITAMSSELNAIGHFIGGSIVVPLTSLLTLLTFAGYMMMLDPRLGLISVVSYPLELILLPVLQNRYNLLNIKRIYITRSFSDTISEAISGINEIHGNASFKLELNKSGVYIKNLFDVLKKMSLFKFGIKFANNLFQNIGPFLLFLVGGYFTIKGEFTIGALVAFLSAYEKVYDPWKELIEYYQELQDTQVRYRRVMDHFDHVPLLPLTHPVNANKITGPIEINNVSYTLNDQVQLIDNVDITIDQGEHIALVGPSGSGKSTLAMLIGQQHLTTKGQIIIGGIELASMAKSDVARNIGFVAQQPIVFNGTIKDNLLYGCKSLENGRSNSHAYQLTSERELYQIIEDIGFKDDLIHLGLNQLIGTESPDFIRKILSVRLSLHSELMEQNKNAIEFYHVNHYMKHLNIYRNLIFGEINDPSYHLEHVVYNDHFLKFLKDMDLMAVLLKLGRRIAEEIVALLSDVEDDAFFFEGIPMPPLEFPEIKKLIGKMSLSDKRDLNEKDHTIFLKLALRYVPAQHKIVTLKKSLQKRIIGARHQFIGKFGKRNTDQCQNYMPLLSRSKGSNLKSEDSTDLYHVYCLSEYLTSMSLLENIIFGTPVQKVSSQKIRLHDLIIQQLEKHDMLKDIITIGLDFQVGSKGDRLSGGQKQKISIIRALLKDPPILILDEATASLDNHSQMKIKNYIQKSLKGKTTVIHVLHRLDLTASYDRIIVLESGKVVELGTYSELLTRKGVFYELVQAN